MDKTGVEGDERGSYRRKEAVGKEGQSVEKMLTEGGGFEGLEKEGRRVLTNSKGTAMPGRRESRAKAPSQSIVWKGR